MKFSKTTEYALRILTYMVKDSSKLHSAKKLVEDLKISDKYLRKLMTDLTKTGFIVSLQGRDGGYKFLREPENIKIIDVIEAIEGIEAYTSCALGFPHCGDINPCALHSIWAPIRDEFMKMIQEKSLRDLDITKVSTF